MATTGAFVLWGLFPVFWKQLHGVDPVELIAHRFVWSLCFLVPVVMLRGSLGRFLSALRDARAAGVHLASGGLLAVNWLVFVWAVNNDRVVEAALGYFLTPLVNVALGVVVLKERLRPAQAVALAMAAAGVVLLVVWHGSVPWVALALAATFGSYGLLRKRSSLGSLAGLTLETAILAPVAVGFLVWRHATGDGALGTTGTVQTAFILASGIVTAVPLLLFARGARLIRLATVGLLQYIAPSVQLVIGVAVYSEPLPPERLWAFAMVWVALVLYSIDSVRTARRTAPIP